MPISLDSYRTFYFVAQYQSITKASEALFSNQPNVTRTVKNLEQDLGCVLFHRSRKGVQLTPEGEILLSYIQPAMEQIQAGEETLQLYKDLDIGTVRIVASEFALQQTILPVLTEFRKLHPKIHIRIQSAATPEAIRSLLERSVDFAIVSSDIEEQKLLEKKCLLSYRDVPVCAQSFEITEQEPLSYEQLSSYPFVIMKKGTATQSLYRSFFNAQGLSIRSDIEAASSSQILPLVHAELGIGFIPEYIAKRASYKGFKIIELQKSLPLRSVCMLKRKDTPQSIASIELEKMLCATNYNENSHSNREYK